MRYVRESIAMVLGAALLVACADTTTTSTTSRGRKTVVGSSSGAADDGDDGADDEGTSGTTRGSSGTTTPTGATASSSGSSGTTPTAGGSFDIILDKQTVSADMAQTMKVQVTVEPKNGFSGPVKLSAVGAVGDASITFDKTELQLSGAAATAMMTVTTKTTTAPADYPVKVAAAGSAGSTPVSREAEVKLTVNPTLTLAIKMNPSTTDYIDAPKTIPVAVGTAANVKVRFVNQDSTGHIIHAGSPGFPHGNTNSPIPNGGTDPTARAVQAGSTYAFYLHDVNATSGSQYRIQAQ
jgi:hypothetical protein